MKTMIRYLSALFFLAISFCWTPLSVAEINFQCPTNGGSYSDINGDGIIRADDGEIVNPVSPNQVCMHVGSGDGFITMADGREMYIFSYFNLTNVPDNQAMTEGLLAATFPAPEIELKQGDEFYLSLTNVGMMVRPDLFDAHTIHWHGFPEAATIFDGIPELSIAVNMGATLTYYYKVNDPGSYIWHCHVEATEHMEMGMIGNIYVTPTQNDLADQTDLDGFTHATGNKYAYNDGDGSTYYDVEKNIQITTFDSNFHDASETVQPLPFITMKANYGMINGRGYPDTVYRDDDLLPPYDDDLPPPVKNGGIVSQPDGALIEATQGQKILLRLNNVSITRSFTISILGIPMQVVGKDARLLRGPTGLNLYYMTNTVTMGGGEHVDVILDTAGVPIGDYFLYTTNLNFLNNNQEDFGGIMTEIRIN